jgi:hypothetical protein
MQIKPYSALHLLLGLITGRLVQSLPERERNVWIRCIVGAAFAWLLASALLSGCTIEAEGHKLALTPLPGWSWSYSGTTTNATERAK